jgi:hypothetical protein
MSGRKTRRPGEFTIPPGSGFGKAHRCTCWPRPDDSFPCTPQTCEPRCQACRVHGRPFYSYGDLLYLEHGTGPLAAELDRLWRVRGAGKRRTVRDEAGNALRVICGRRSSGAAMGPRAVAR